MGLGGGGGGRHGTARGSGGMMSDQGGGGGGQASSSVGGTDGVPVGGSLFRVCVALLEVLVQFLGDPALFLPVLREQGVLPALSKAFTAATSAAALTFEAHSVWWSRRLHQSRASSAAATGAASASSSASGVGFGGGGGGIGGGGIGGGGMRGRYGSAAGGYARGSGRRAGGGFAAAAGGGIGIGGGAGAGAGVSVGGASDGAAAGGIGEDTGVGEAANLSDAAHAAVAESMDRAEVVLHFFLYLAQDAVCAAELLQCGVMRMLLSDRMLRRMETVMRARVADEEAGVLTGSRHFSMHSDGGGSGGGGGSGSHPSHGFGAQLWRGRGFGLHPTSFRGYDGDGERSGAHRVWCITVQLVSHLQRTFLAAERFATAAARQGVASEPGAAGISQLTTSMADLAFDFTDTYRCRLLSALCNRAFTVAALEEATGAMRLVETNLGRIAEWRLRGTGTGSAAASSTVHSIGQFLRAAEALVADVALCLNATSSADASTASIASAGQGDDAFRVRWVHLWQIKGFSFHAVSVREKQVEAVKRAKYNARRALLAVLRSKSQVRCGCMCACVGVVVGVRRHHLGADEVAVLSGVAVTHRAHCCCTPAAVPTQSHRKKGDAENESSSSNDVVPFQVLIEASLTSLVRVALDVVRKHEERNLVRHGRLAAPCLLAQFHTPSHWLTKLPPGTGHLFLLARYCVKRWGMYEVRHASSEEGPEGPSEDVLRGIMRPVLLLLTILIDHHMQRGDVSGTVIGEMAHHVSRVLGNGLDEEETDASTLDDRASTRSSTLTSASLVSGSEQSNMSAIVATVIGDKEFAMTLIRTLKAMLGDGSDGRVRTHLALPTAFACWGCCLTCLCVRVCVCVCVRVCVRDVARVLCPWVSRALRRALSVPSTSGEPPEVVSVSACNDGTHKKKGVRMVGGTVTCNSADYVSC